MDTLPESDDDLLLECDVQTFRSSGKGGQHANKVETGVRLHHRPTGIVVISRTERSQHRNKIACLGRLRARLELLNRLVPPRIATRVPASTRRKNRVAKERRSATKRLRTKPQPED